MEGDGRSLYTTKIGNVKAIFLVYSKRSVITLVNVFYVKYMVSNLISYAKVIDNYNRIISVGNDTNIYNRYNELIAIAIREYNLFKMRSVIK